MNYYGPRQRKEDGRWDYTCMNDKQVWPVGYCHAYRPLNGSIFSEREIARYDEQNRPFLDKFHEGGHATREEACECYKQFLLDHDLRLMQEDKDTQHKCQTCGTWTQHYADMPGEYKQFWLCPDHNNRSEVERLLPTPDQCCCS